MSGVLSCTLILNFIPFDWISRFGAEGLILFALNILRNVIQLHHETTAEFPFFLSLFYIDIVTANIVVFVTGDKIDSQ